MSVTRRNVGERLLRHHPAHPALMYLLVGYTVIEPLIAAGGRKLRLRR